MNWQEILTPIAYRGTKIIAIIIGAWLVQKLLVTFITQFKKRIKKTRSETIAQKRQRIKTITSLLVNTSRIVINLIAFLLILTEAGVNIWPLLTGVGILGLGVGMGARTLVSDLIAGFFILLENQFNVGDWIKVGGTEGKVVKISLRTITLKGKDNSLYIIPNSSITIIQKFSKQS